MVFYALVLAGAGVAIWQRVRAARGNDPLGPRPRGELPNTALALILGAGAWLVLREAVGYALVGSQLHRHGGFDLDVVAVTTVNLLIALAVLHIARSGTFAASLSPGRLVAAGLIGGLVVFAAAQGLAMAIEGLYRHFGEPVPQQSVVDHARGARGLALTTLALAAVVVAPFAEEIFFRGVLLPALARLGTVRGGLAIQALLFGAIHVVGDLHTWPLAIPLAVVGWICGWLYLRTGSLAVPVLAHATFNAINFAGLLAGQ